MPADKFSILLSLPHCTYFVNLACTLGEIWQEVDRTLKPDIKIDDLRDLIDDISDLLMYIQDIFDLNIPVLTRAMANCLLYYAYYPNIFSSIDQKQLTPLIEGYPAVIFFLIQTFDIIKEPIFINSLSISLFMPNCNKRVK